MSTLIMWHKRFSENENETMEVHLPRHRYSITEKPRHRHSRPKNPRHRVFTEFWPLSPLMFSRFYVPSINWIPKTLRNTIMRRSALEKKANNSNDPLAIILNKKTKKLVVNLSWKAKKDYFQKHMPHGSSSKNFRKFWKPFFTNEITNFDDKIMLMENEKAVSKNEDIAYLFNIYFNDITTHLACDVVATSHLGLI